MLFLYILLSAYLLIPTSDDGCGWGAQTVTCFDAALLHPEGIEVQLSSLQQFLGFLM